ncbi:MAG: hypothetical protein QXU47_07070 [Candidatus Bathyarchaeia archaeon]
MKWGKHSLTIDRVVVSSFKPSMRGAIPPLDPSELIGGRGYVCLLKTV